MGRAHALFPASIQTLGLDQPETASLADAAATTLPAWQAAMLAVGRHVAVAITDASGRITEANDRFCDTIGQARGALLGRTLDVLATGTPAPDLCAQITQALATGRTWQAELGWHRQDGQHCWAEATVAPWPDAPGAAGQRIALLTDITPRKAAEATLAQLQQRHAKLSLLLDESSDPIFAFDPEGRYQYVNRIFASTLGLTVDQVIGRTVWDIFPGEGGDRRFAVVRKAFQQGTTETIEVAIPVPGGCRHLITTAKPVRDATGAVVAVLCVSKDVTALKQAESAAQAASRSKSAFLATMSHEIRTPMNGMLGMAQLGYRQSAGRLQAQATFAQILDSGKLLLTILNDILDFSKIEAGQLTIESVPVDLRRIVENALYPFQEMAAGKAIQLTSTLDAGVPAALRGDPVRIAQVILNLLSNAIKFTDAGSVALTAARHGDEIRISVRDTGIGMDAHQLAHLFTPFRQGDSSTTRRYGGTGLGLTISRQLAQLMGGDLRVQSAPGHGSTFLLTLPCHPCDHAPLPPAAAPTPGSAARRLAGLRVLVAEDNAVNQLVIQDMLALEGAHVTLAANGQLAVQAVARNPAAFDLVLMDLQMPVMDGLDATRALAQVAPGLPVLGQTAHAMPEERAACLQAGMVATIAKPIDLEDLVATLHQHAPRAPVAPAAQPAHAAGLIDWTQLAQRHRRNPALVPRLLQLARDGLAPVPAQLRQAADAADWPALAQTAHLVKGTCGDMFAQPPLALAAATEQAARAASPDAAALARQLATLADALLLELQARLTAHAPPGA